MSVCALYKHIHIHTAGYRAQKRFLTASKCALLYVNVKQYLIVLFYFYFILKDTITMLYFF